MCSDTVLCIDSDVFDEMISEIQNTRTQLEQSLIRSEKILKKLCQLKTISTIYFSGNNLNNIIYDKQI